MASSGERKFPCTASSSGPQHAKTSSTRRQPMGKVDVIDLTEDDPSNVVAPGESIKASSSGIQNSHPVKLPRESSAIVGNSNVSFDSAGERTSTSSKVTYGLSKIGVSQRLNPGPTSSLTSDSAVIESILNDRLLLMSQEDLPELGTIPATDGFSVNASAFHRQTNAVQAGRPSRPQQVPEKVDLPIAHEPVRVGEGVPLACALDFTENNPRASSPEWRKRYEGRLFGQYKNPDREHTSRVTLSDQKKLNRSVQRVRNGLINEFRSIPMKCHCEQTWILGCNGTLDRFSRDVTNAWIDYKTHLRTPWTPAGAKEAGIQTVCQARMSVGNQLLKCTRLIASKFRGHLFHASANKPLLALCDTHIAGIQAHLACPLCGIFCEVGEFKACSASTGHLYHESCSDAFGPISCGHCLNPSEHVTVKIEDPGRPGIELIDFFSANQIDEELTMSPSQTLPNVNIPPTSKYFRDLATGIRISCADLPKLESKALQSELENLKISESQLYDWLDFFKMISFGDIAGVLKFLNYGANIQNMYLKAMEFRQKGKDLYHFPVTGPLHLAVKEHQLAILYILLQAGFPTNFPDKRGYLLFEQAAIQGNNAALVLLRKFFKVLPHRALREMSLRKLLGAGQHRAIALLIKCGFYNFHEFSTTRDDVREVLELILCSGDPISITAALECQHVLSLLHFSGLGSALLLKLGSAPKNKFAVGCLLRFNIIAREDMSSGGLSTEPSESVHREPVIKADISGGRELHPVSVIGDSKTLPMLPFQYVCEPVIEQELRSHTMVGHASQTGCECPANATCLASCSCSSLGDASPYTPDGKLDLQKFDGQRIVECTRSCTCAGLCKNRVSQSQSRGFFEVFLANAEKELWAVRSKYILPPGYLVGTIAGSVWPQTEVLNFLENDSKEHFIVPCVTTGYSLVTTRSFGNFTRFVGRGENGNLLAVAVMTDGDVGGIPRIALFTKQVVFAYEALVIDTSTMEKESLRRADHQTFVYDRSKAPACDIIAESLIGKQQVPPRGGNMSSSSLLRKTCVAPRTGSLVNRRETDISSSVDMTGKRLPLWKFLLSMLEDRNSSRKRLIEWEDYGEKIFRIIDSNEVARLWGAHKGNPKMTYENLSRALRNYQTSGVFDSFPTPRQLTFRFAANFVQNGWSLPVPSANLD